MVGLPQKRPRDKFGTSQGHPERLGRYMRKFTFKGQNVHGTDGTHDGKDGTYSHSRDRMSAAQTGHTPGGVPPKFLYVYWRFLFFPKTRRGLRVVSYRLFFLPLIKVTRAQVQNSEGHNGPGLAIPLAWYRIGFGPPARSMKKIGKIFGGPKPILHQANGIAILDTLGTLILRFRWPFTGVPTGRAPG